MIPLKSAMFMLGCGIALGAAVTFARELSLAEQQGQGGQGRSRQAAADRRASLGRIPVTKEPLKKAVRWREFPAAPPPASAKYAIPNRLLIGGARDSLGAVALRVRDALERAQIQEWAVYPFGSDGFAYVTRLEQIEPDGRPKPGPARWPETYGTSPNDASFGQFLKSLFVAEPGYYRVIAIVVSSRPVADTGSTKTYREIAGAVRGPTVLPPRMLPKRVAGLTATALIYEFRAPNRDSHPILLNRSATQPVQHLAYAGLWSERDLTGR